MSFKNNKYLVIKKVISKELADFFNQYIFLKRDVITNLYKNKLLKPNSFYGIWDDEQVPGHYSCYSDYAAETLLSNLKPLIEKETKLKLHPAYTYLRIYDKGAVLKKHTDRPSCEISATLNISGDSWPIYLIKNKKRIDIDLSPGDLLLYKGAELEHGRDKFKGKYCTQVFLHYVKNISKNKHLIYDGRVSLGFPSFIKSN